MDFNDSLEQAGFRLEVKAGFVWKEKQKECLKAVYDGIDFMAVLPTGFGKSLIFQAAPFLLAAKNGQDIYDTNNIIVIITPLNSIMMSHCKALCSKGIKACYLDYCCKGELMMLT